MDETIRNTPEKWMIWSIEHNMWWAPARKGYVQMRADAGVYSYEEACEIVREANKYTSLMPAEAMVKIEIEV